MICRLRPPTFPRSMLMHASRYLARECFAGQIIVCCVVVAFVTVFLLREWVIANQPLNGGNQRRVGGAEEALQPVPHVVPPPALLAEPGRQIPTEGLAPLHSEPADLHENDVPEADLRQPLDFSLPTNGPISPRSTTDPDALEPGSTRVAMSEAAQAYLERQRQMAGVTVEPPAIAGGTVAATDQDLHLSAADVRADRLDTASQHSSDSEDSLDRDHPAHPAANAGDLGAADLAAIQAAEAEEEFFIEADILGILEAIGVLGPIVALVQNAALMTLLLVTLLAAGLWAPLMLGKTLAAVRWHFSVYRLKFTDSYNGQTDAYKLLLLPINIVRLGTDPIASLLLAFSGKGSKSATRLTTGSFLARTLPTSVKTLYTTHVTSRVSVLASQASRVLRAASALWRSMPRNDSTIDRVCCILLGYVVVLATAIICLRHTRNVQARNATLAFREAIKQQVILAKVRIWCSCVEYTN